MRNLRTVKPGQLTALSAAIDDLRSARDNLIAGGASRKLVDEARSMIKRAAGAERHAARATRNVW